MALRASLQAGLLQQPLAQVIDGSLKFTEGPSDNNGTTLINRDFANEGNRKVFTFSCWFKSGNLGGTRDNQYLFSTEYELDGNTRGFALFWNRTTGGIGAYDYAASPTVWSPTSSERNCRDTGWFHIVFAVDTYATDGNRVKLYINGERDTGMGEPARNVTLNVNRTDFEHYIGSHNYQGNQIRYVDGYLSQVYFIDGQALDASYFGFTDTLTNTWRPKKYVRGVFEELDAFNTYTWGETQNSLRYQGIKFPSSAGGTVAWKAIDGSVSGLNLYTSTDNSNWTRRLTNQTVDSTNGLVYESSDQYVILVNDTDTNWGNTQIQMFSDVNGATIHYSNVTYPGNGSPTMSWSGPAYTDGTIGTYNSLYFPLDGNTPITQDKSGNGNDWTAEGFGGSVALDNPKVSGARPILNTTQGGTHAGVGVFGSKENKYYTVTTANGSVYQFDITSGDNPSLSFIRGATYKFDYSSFTGHPVLFSSTNPDSSTTAYTDGTSIASNVISFTVPHDAPDTLYYYCQNHPTSMNGSISITTDETKADPYAWKNILGLPLVGSANDVSNQINSGSTTKTLTTTGATASSANSNFYSGSLSFDGSDDRIVSATSSDFTFGTGDFTIEGWVYPETNNANKCVFSTNWGASGSLIITYSHPQSPSAAGKFAIFDHTQNNGQPTVATTNTYGLNKWHHVAFVRNGTSHKFYINGIEDGSATYTASDLTRDVFVLGAVYTNGTETFDGYIQDVRVYKGLAKYTSNFIIPSADPDILPDTPSGVAGGSKLVKIIDGAVSFDGTGDFLGLANSTDTNFGSGDFTVECHAYFTSVSAETLLGQWENSTNRRSWLLQVNSGQLSCYLSADGTTTGQKRIDSASGAISTNRWYHLAYARSGDTMRLFIDGEQVGSVDVTGFTNYANTDDGFQVGSQTAAGSNLMSGFISNARIIKGTGIYTSNFTPPSAPLTDVTNTKLLCCQSNVTSGAAAVSSNLGGINNGTVWSDYLSISSGGSVSNEPADAFSGYTWDFSDAANSGYSNDNTGNYIRFDPPAGTLVGQVVKLYQRIRPSTVTINGTSATITTSGNTRICTVDLGSSQNITSVITTATTDGQTNAFGYLEVDGVRVKDPVSSRGDAAATIFTPFNTDINEVRGQETGYPTMSPLARNSAISLEDGNLRITQTDSHGQKKIVYSTAKIPNGGKWYVEWTVGGGACTLGIGKNGKVDFRGTDTQIGTDTNSWGYEPNGNLFHNGNLGGSYPAASAGDVIGMTIDTTGGSLTIQWYKNDVLIRNSSGTIAQFTGISLDEDYIVMMSHHTPNYDTLVNFGQKPFKFPPPDGFQPINAANARPETVIVRPDQYVGIVTYTGDGTNNRVIEAPLDADFSWVKYRNQSYSHSLYDTVRGNNKRLVSNSNSQEGTVSFSFLNNKRIQVSGASDTSHNDNGDPILTWLWKAGGSKGTFNVDDVGYANASDVNMNTGSLNSSFYNTSHSISGNITTTDITFASGKELSKWFDGQRDTRMEPAGSGTMDFTGISALQNFTGTLQFAVTAYSPDASMKFVVNGIHTFDSTMFPGDTGESDYFPAKTRWITIPVTSLETVEFTSISARSTQFWGMFLDGKQLVDSGVTPDSLPSIPTTGCSVGTKQGFSIITYTGNTSGSDGRIPHGLSQEPDFLIFKSRNTGDNWAVFWSTLGRKYMELQSNGYSNAGNPQNRWSSMPSDKVIYLGSDTNINNVNHIMYCWHNVPGLQKFGSYSTNGDGSGGGSEDGTFVHLGFRPALILFKGSSYTSDWTWIDEERCKINYNDVAMRANYQYGEIGNSRGGVGSTSQPENYAVDFLSNGFKIRASGGSLNSSGQTVCYAAWAKAPQFNLYGAEANAK